LRGHGLVRKLPGRRRYRTTQLGRDLLYAVIAVHDRDIPALLSAA